MLTKRQYSILEFLIEHEECYISSKELSNQFHISIRTVKNDLKIIKTFSDKFSSFHLETLPSKGTRILIENKKIFQEEALQLKMKIEQAVIHPNQDRCNSIIRILLNTRDYLSKYTLMETFYISESTLYNTIHEVRQTLHTYNLQLLYKTNYGYKIEGSEADKRLCIVKNNLLYEPADPYTLSKKIVHIYNIVADAFFKYHYQISEQALQNITSHINLTIQRVKSGNIISDIQELYTSDMTEYKISEEILHHFLSVYRLDDHTFQKEVSLLTQTILGKSSYSKDEALKKEINEFINEGFQAIYTKFSVNFEANENLKLFLALHLIPLFYRVKSRTQLVNVMSVEIRQSFPLAYDIAIFFSLLISQKFHLNISQDEVSYLSLYFNYGLENLTIGSKTKRILILTSLRQSETILLRHRILTWFPNQIAEIAFIDSDTEDVDLESYDAVFSTDGNLHKYKGGITKISIFPDEKDFEKINLSINGYTDIHSILSKFSKDCYYTGNATEKNEVLSILYKNAAKKYSLPKNFLSVIQSREDISSTYFGNSIALPHPLTPLSEETFVSVAVLNNPILWDHNHKVQLIMLISIEINNPKAFQFWYYISNMIRNEATVKNIIHHPTYDNFITLLQKSLEDEFV